ncbi:MAG: hypothetical protein V4592_08220 [Bacteroidota bacterium]
MLRNELRHFDPGNCDEIIAAWDAAAFSEAGDDALRRYFNYHLQVLSNAPDENALVLIDHLFRFYAVYLDSAIYAPKTYHRRLLEQMKPAIGHLKNVLVGDELTGVLSDYFVDMDAAGFRYSYATLAYFEKLVFKVAKLETVEEIVTGLVSLNFNHLGFYNYLKANRYAIDQPISPMVYDKAWPSLDVMLANQPKVDVKTLGLDLSVAHLACLLRVNFLEGTYGKASLQEVFHFTATHYYTRRQAHISEKSLAKEYYSVSQVTAAVVRDQLLKQVARINREFFPA